MLPLHSRESSDWSGLTILVIRLVRIVTIGLGVFVTIGIIITLNIILVDIFTVAIAIVVEFSIWSGVAIVMTMIVAGI